MNTTKLVRREDLEREIESIDKASIYIKALEYTNSTNAGVYVISAKTGEHYIKSVPCFDVMANINSDEIVLLKVDESKKQQFNFNELEEESYIQLVDNEIKPRLKEKGVNEDVLKNRDKCVRKFIEIFGEALYDELYKEQIECDKDGFRASSDDQIISFIGYDVDDVENQINGIYNA